MNWGRLFLGVIVLALGVLFLLDSANVIDDAGDLVGTWWPLAVVLAAVLTYAANRRHWPVALVVGLLGAVLLLSTLDVLDLGNVILPLVLIAVGLFIIFGRSMGHRTEATGDTVNSFNVFSGTETASHSKNFEGGTVSVLFGGAELDLRDAYPAPGAALDVVAAFGGVEIMVPQGWQVDIKGFPVFGGFDNITAKESLSPDAPVLAVNATVLFGGLEVRH